MFIGTSACEYKYPERPEEGARSSSTGVTLGCKPPEWVLGTEMRSSGRVIYALYYKDCSLALIKHLDHFIFICVCVCVVHVCMWMDMYVHVCRGQKLAPGIFPKFSPPWCRVEFSEFACVETVYR